MELNVSPGKFLGPFALGSPLGSVVEWLIVNERVVPRVELVYTCDQVTQDVVLDLVDQSTVLRFSGNQQILTMIHVYDLSSVRIRYGATLFSKGAPTFSSLYSVFGPSYPGEWKEESSMYWLSYPGLTMTFRCSDVIDGIPIALQDNSGSPPTANDLYVFSGKTLSQRDSISLQRTRSLHGCQNYFERIVARPQHGIEFTDRKFEICFGDGAQTVLAALGEPEGEYQKVDDKLKIHESPEGGVISTDEALPYFWNYFSLGIDFLFDGKTHTISKIKLHSNCIGHSNFHHYSRCNWVLSPANISYLTKWPEASTVLGITEHNAPLVSMGTVYHGIDDGVIVEIMKSDSIASVLLF